MDNQYWVQAAPFRALLVRLLELSGLPPAVLARYAGVEPAIVRRLLHGRGGRAPRRIPADCARRLLAVDEASLSRLGRLRFEALR